MAPIHICEVVVRNCVSDALEAVYGPRWPWDPTFLLSLPDIYGHYNPRRDLRTVALAQPTTGKVIPELKFVFWQEMFTKRHDTRIWKPHLKRVFPGHDPAKSVVALRKKIYADLGEIRELRNRIAHHEPIFTRRLSEDFEILVELVRLKCQLVASWMVGNQNADALIARPPMFKGGKLWQPSHDEIASIAYCLWCAGGKKENSADEDCANAEKILSNP